MPIDQLLSEARRPFTTQMVMKGGVYVGTLSGNVTLTRRSAQMLRLDPGGASRNVTLPSLEDGLFFRIENSADAVENLVVKNAAATTIVTLARGEGCDVWCNGTAWYAFARGYIEASQEDRVYRVSGTIAFAAVRTLNATPVSVISAPGAGLFVDVLDCHWFLDYGTATYDGAAAGDTLSLHYTNGSGAATVDAVAGNAIGAASADYHTMVRAVPEVIPVANAAIVAALQAGEWYVAAGDSPLKYEINYRIRTLAL